MRQSSQGTLFMVQSGALGASADISAATKAKPSVLTFDTAVPAGMVAGSVIIPSKTAWKSLDGRPFVVDPLAALDATLFDSDTTREVNAFGADAEAGVVTWSEACMATLTLTNPAGNTIDATTLCDDARVTLSGMPAISTWQATGFWDADDAVQTALQDLYRSGDYVAFQVKFKDGSGLTFMANVTSFDIRAGVDQAVAITVGGNLSGRMSRLPKTAGVALAAPTPPPPAPEPAPAPEPTA
jgi:Lambda phage tail tube protein, TTP